MKVEIKKEKPKFDPVTIELTFETKEGLGLFSQLFNHARITGMCPEFRIIYKELRGIREREGWNMFEKVDTVLRG